MPKHVVTSPVDVGLRPGQTVLGRVHDLAAHGVWVGQPTGGSAHLLSSRQPNLKCRANKAQWHQGPKPRPTTGKAKTLCGRSIDVKVMHVYYNDELGALHCLHCKKKATNLSPQSAQKITEQERREMWGDTHTDLDRCVLEHQRRVNDLRDRRLKLRISIRKQQVEIEEIENELKEIGEL